MTDKIVDRNQKLQSFSSNLTNSRVFGPDRFLFVFFFNEEGEITQMHCHTRFSLKMKVTSDP